MSGRSSNVIPMRPGRPAPSPTATTVLHAVADDAGLVEVASVVAAIERRAAFRQLVVHAGDAPERLGAKLPGVHHQIDVPAGTPAERTAAALTGYEALLLEHQPDIVLVAG